MLIGGPNHQRRQIVVQSATHLIGLNLVVVSRDDLRRLQSDNQVDITGLPSIAFADRSCLPRIPAVYFVFEGDYLLYVGRSGNLRQRWLNNWHDKYALLCERHPITIAWFETADVKMLERRLILVLRPPLNRLMPRGCQPASSYCSVQLPEKTPEAQRRGEFGVDWLVCKCKRCGYKWVSRKGLPKVCAKRTCHSPIWNKPKK